MIRSKKSAPITAPTNEPRPPRKLAPPTMQAAMLVSVNVLPAFGSPIWTCAPRNRPPTADMNEHVTKAPERIRRAGIAKPLGRARIHADGARCETLRESGTTRCPQSSARTVTPMNEIGMNPQLFVRAS